MEKLVKLVELDGLGTLRFTYRKLSGSNYANLTNPTNETCYHYFLHHKTETFK